ncbi:hypothetical protein H9657_17815 [Cellulomonas sp. Sa3CUA2]|uniref:Uncharacterized protein n=1 Tax=Cellulomonas avistercoris TaxID=2762242 RepID=A0ABR8QI84_9CELL|nr:hypothetical protein [Cellulomonas avistercoris]MBD7920133.1 hypothetical protein [Cellulomonas avistercoris]
MRTRRTRAIAEAALARLVAQLDGRTDGRAWQWVMTLEGAPVRIDLLTDVLDHRGQQLAVPGCTRMTVQNVAGPAPALRDPVIRRLPVRSGDDLTAWVDVPFANLGGYLLAKAAAVLGRRADRDPYDLAFVVQHNTAGGPRAAGRAARAALPPGREQEFEGVLRAALAQLTDPDGRAARLYATQRVADGDPLPVDVLAADAAAAARQCLAELDR